MGTTTYITKSRLYVSFVQGRCILFYRNEPCVWEYGCCWPLYQGKAHFSVSFYITTLYIFSCHLLCFAFIRCILLSLVIFCCHSLYFTVILLLYVFYSKCFIQLCNFIFSWIYLCMWSHETDSGYYRVSTYFLAKVFCDIIPTRLLSIITFSVVSYWMIG